MALINWFSKSKIPTTFYLVREQASRKIRIAPGETRNDLFSLLSSSPYIDSCLIILKIKQHNTFPYYKNLDKFLGKGIVTYDRKKKGVSDFIKYDLYDQGNIHGKCTIVNALHLAWYLKYKRILFVGVDLYDSRYFWIPEGETRYSVKQKKRTFKSRHPIAPIVVSSIKAFKKCYPEIKMFTYNPKSILRKHMSRWEE